MKSILILSTSLRSNSNSAALADEFARGARDAGHTAEVVSLAHKDIHFCKGCLACQKTKRCVIRDDADELAQKMGRADVLVFATPIYYYEMSGQMKTMLDRANPLFAAGYAFKEVYLLTTAAEDGEPVWRRAKSGLEGWLKCFPKAKLAGAIFCGGVGGPGEAQGHPAMEEAYLAGKNA